MQIFRLAAQEVRQRAVQTPSTVLMAQELREVGREVEWARVPRVAELSCLAPLLEASALQTILLLTMLTRDYVAVAVVVEQQPLPEEEARLVRAVVVPEPRPVAVVGLVEGAAVQDLR